MKLNYLKYKLFAHFYQVLDYFFLVMGDSNCFLFILGEGIQKVKMARPKNSKVKAFFQRNLLTMLTVAGVVGGTITGCIIRATQSEKWSEREVMYLQFPGDLFLRMLKALIIPLLTSSIISAIGALDLSLSKKIAIRSICYYACTTVCAVILGIVLVVTIRPGVGARDLQEQSVRKVTRDVLTVDTLLDLIR